MSGLVRQMKIAAAMIILCISGTATDAAFEGVELGARPLGMGSAFTAAADDASAIFWNSAGLVQINGRELITSYMELYDLVSYSSIGYAQNTKIGPMGVGLVSSSDVDGAYREITLAVSAAREVYHGLSVGANIKYLSSAANTGNIRIGSGRGLSLDLGCQYRIADDLLSFGAALQNPVGYVSYNREAVKDIPGQTYWQKPGLSYKMGVGVDLGRLLSQVEKSVQAFGKSLSKKESKKSVLAAELSDGAIHIGTEYVFWDVLAVRAGYRTGNALSRAITTGFGVKLSALTLDYAYVGSAVGSQTSQFSVSVNW